MKASRLERAGEAAGSVHSYLNFDLEDEWAREALWASENPARPLTLLEVHSRQWIMLNSHHNPCAHEKPLPSPHLSFTILIMYDVMFYEAFEEEARQIQALLPKDLSCKMTSQTIQEAAEVDCPAGLISIRTQSIIPLEWAEQLKGIQTRSTGYDHLLAYQRSTATDLPCGYLPNYCARAVAEQAVMMMLSLLRKQKAQTRNLASFDRDGLTGRESKERNLLVVGVGRIGSQVVDLGKGLRMKVKGVDIDPRLDGITYIDLEEGLSWAEVIVCALPLTAATKEMFGYARLSKAQPGALFINIARGEISPVKDLTRLMEEGRLGGIGLDVYDGEAVVAGALRAGQTNRQTEQVLALAQQDNVILTPHNAFNTEDAVKEKAKESVRAVEQFLSSQTFPDTVPEE